MINRQEKLPGVHAMRGYAALLVVFCHAADAINRYTNTSSFKWLLEGGFVGVCFFFVLSGFIMSYIHGADEKNRTTGKVFALKRVTRVVPIYWITTLLIFGALQFNSEFGAETHHSFKGLIQSLFFVPMFDGPILRVGWTLVHEMLFYLIFAISFYLVKKPKTIFFIWMVCIVSFGLKQNPAITDLSAESSQLALLLPVLLSPLNLLFLMGLITTSPRARSLFYGITEVRYLRSILLSLLVLMALMWYLEKTYLLFSGSSISWIRPVLYGILSMGILIVAAEQRVGQSFSNRFHKLFGDASYSIYLIHYYAITVAALLMTKLRLMPLVHPVMQLLILIIVGICSGIVFHYLLEKPLTICISRKMKMNPSRKSVS
jgi:exopolysaccharide production protein ExoZ